MIFNGSQVCKSLFTAVTHRALSSLILFPTDEAHLVLRYPISPTLSFSLFYQQTL